jgi:hypothetical protein
MEVDLVTWASVGALKVGCELMTQLSPEGEGPLCQVQEPRLGHTGEGHWEVAGHDILIPSCIEN